MNLYTVQNSTLSASGWADRIGISRQAMASRIRKATTKKELQKALTTPSQQGFRADCKKT